jgi:hypothetical protein
LGLRARWTAFIQLSEKSRYSWSVALVVVAVVEVADVERRIGEAEVDPAFRTLVEGP